MFFKFTQGRQGTGYEKMTLISVNLPFFKRIKGFDLHILRYRVGSHIPYHTDNVNLNFEHHRLNIVFWNTSDAIFRIEGIPQFGIFHKFRPDIKKHSLSVLNLGSRYVLSIGWLKAIK